MSVSQAARDRGVTQVVHYTHNHGLMGTIMKHAVLSRDRVERDPDIAFVFEGVWERRDHEWTDTISMSIQRVNGDLMARSRKRFSDETWWAVLAFDPAVLDDPGVVFCDQNNTYEPCRRAEGLDGFRAMYADPVIWGHYATPAHRGSLEDCYPTHSSAELLYPGLLGLEYLTAIHVPGSQHRSLVRVWSQLYDAGDLAVIVGRPEAYS